MNSFLHGLIIPATCIFPSLVYVYKQYKEKKSTRLEFVLTNIIAGLAVFTIYLAEITLK